MESNWVAPLLVEILMGIVPLPTLLLDFRWSKIIDKKLACFNYFSYVSTVIEWGCSHNLKMFLL